MDRDAKIEDVHCLAQRLEVLSDIVSYNATLVMGEKYEKWVRKHRSLVNELNFLIQEDLKPKAKECDDEKMAS